MGISHAFKDMYRPYAEAGIGVIPDKFQSKAPAIKGWQNFCKSQPDDTNYSNWSNSFRECNISIPLGPASGICVLDVDTNDPNILEAVKKHMPDSPVVRLGSKGFALFYRWHEGIHTDALKDGNGNIYIELLAEKKKITIPPSIHPNGMPYRWEGHSLLQVGVENLQPMPPGTLPALAGICAPFISKSRFFDIKTNQVSMKVSNGRTDALAKEAGRLISEMEAGRETMDGAVNKLLAYDLENHTPPKFVDVEGMEVSHNHGLTNAYRFFLDILNTVQTKRFENNTQFATIMASESLNKEAKELVLKKKFQKQESQKKSSQECEMSKLPEFASPLMKQVYDFILNQSWVEQPSLAFSATIVLFSTLINRKMVFMGNSPNLFVLNIAPSGSGKDAPQQNVKNILKTVKRHLLGAGDYVSDASLMDSFDTQKARIDIIDEASGLLSALNRSKNGYDAKMADILCELYTTSNGFFMGRRTAEGRKGECERPFVSLLMSTTPRGLKESLTTEALEKGLLGRCLIFKGDPQKRGRIPDLKPMIDLDVIEKLIEIAEYSPEETHKMDRNISCDYDIVDVMDSEAKETIDNAHKYFEDIRVNSEENKKELPIIARCFQQTCKIALISAASRSPGARPKVTSKDIEFGKAVAEYNLKTFEEVNSELIHDNWHEKMESSIISYIKKRPEGVTARQLSQNKIVNAKNRVYLDNLVKMGVLSIGYEGKKQLYFYKDESDE